MDQKHEIKVVLEHYGGVVPNRRGWTQMKCPLHGDRHASASVNTELNAFSCFACGIKGDTYSIIMQHEGVDFREALTRAEAITGQSSEGLRSGNSFSDRVPGKSRSVLRGGKERFPWRSE